MSCQRVIGAALLTLSFLSGCGGSGGGGGGTGDGGGGTSGEAVISDSAASAALAALSSEGDGGTSEEAAISDSSASAALAALSSEGDGGTSEEAAISDSSAASAASTSLSSSFSPGEAVGVPLTPDAAQGEITAEIDQAPTDVVVDGDEAVVVVPDLPPGTHTLTLKVRGKKISLSFDVAAGLPLTGDARQYVADLIAEALRLLDDYLAAHPDDTAAADLRAQLAAAQAQLASLSDEELQALYEQFAANPLPSADAPGSCVAAAAGHKARLNAFLRTARLTSWLAAKLSAHKADATHVAVVLAQARMDEALRRLVAYTQAVMQSCNADATLEQQTEKARGRRQHSANASAASLR